MTPDMNLSTYLDLRPFLFHTTALENKASILNGMRLFSAETFVARAVPPIPFALDKRRERSVALLLTDGSTVTIRDQKPLASGHIDFESGWDLQRLTRRLNQLVFLWPGTLNGPIGPGRSHANRYVRAGEALLFLRMPAASLLTETRGLFASVNSGSPRTVNGLKSRRGGDTFLLAEFFTGSPSDVVEVAFDTTVDLPPTSECSADGLNWLPLKSADTSHN